MRSVVVVAVFLLQCSNSSTPPVDGGFDAPACDGSPFGCFTNCTDLTPSSTSMCTNEAWTCPSSDCACSAKGSAQIVCVSCADAGVTTYQVCDASSGAYDCPPGTALGECTGDAGVADSGEAGSDASSDAQGD